MKYRKKTNKTKKRELSEIKKKVLELKKDMLFTNSLKKKITKNIINTPRSFRSDDILLPINKDNNLQLTSRTNKSVHFNDGNNQNENDENNDYGFNNSFINTPRTEKYLKLLTEIDLLPLSSRSDTLSYSKALNLSLPLSLDPMSTLESYYNAENNSSIEKKLSKSVQSLEDINNEEFLVEYVLPVAIKFISTSKYILISILNKIKILI